jgi:hypothetical protein
LDRQEKDNDMDDGNGNSNDDDSDDDSDDDETGDDETSDDESDDDEMKKNQTVFEEVVQMDIVEVDVEPTKKKQTMREAEQLLKIMRQKRPATKQNRPVTKQNRPTTSTLPLAKAAPLQMDKKQLRKKYNVVSMRRAKSFCIFQFDLLQNSVFFSSSSKDESDTETEAATDSDDDDDVHEDGYNNHKNKTVSNDSDSEIVNNDMHIEDVPVEQWMVESVTEIEESREGSPMMATVLLQRTVQEQRNTARMTLDDCGKYFEKHLVDRLTKFASDKRTVVAYVEDNSESEALSNLVQLVKKYMWSSRVKDCQCNHSIAAGWKMMDQISYFKTGFRYCGVSCCECLKRIVAAAPTPNEYKAGSGVFLCAVEASEECRGFLCLLCFNKRYANESRPSRKRKTTS